MDTKMKLLVILLFFFMLNRNLVRTNDHEMDFFFDKKSFSAKHNVFMFASCLKGSKENEKTCLVGKTQKYAANGVIPLDSCPLYLDSIKPNGVMGSEVRILPLNSTSAVVLSLEKNTVEMTLIREFFLILTIFAFDNCETVATLAVPLLWHKNDPDIFLNDIHFIVNDSDNTFIVVIDDKRKHSGSQINKIILDYERTEKLKNQQMTIEPWFKLEKGVLKEIVLLNEEFGDNMFLVIDNYNDAYIVDAIRLKSKRLSVDHVKTSKLIYSTSCNIISLCYEANSSFTCVSFKNGERKSEWKFDVEWKVNDGLVHYCSSDFEVLTLITESSSELCKSTEIRQHLTRVSDQQSKSRESDCISKDFKAVGIFPKGPKNCIFRAKFIQTGLTLEIQSNIVCFQGMIDYLINESYKYVFDDLHESHDEL